MRSDVAFGLAFFKVRTEGEEIGEELCLDGEDGIKVWDFLVLYHRLDYLGEVGGGVTLVEHVDITGIYLHIIIYTRARGQFCPFRGVVVEVLLGMGGIGQDLVVAAVDIDVYSGLFFCHFIRFFMVVRPRVLWTYVQRVYARTSLGGKDVRPEGAWTYVHRTFERA